MLRIIRMVCLASSLKTKHLLISILSVFVLIGCESKIQTLPVSPENFPPIKVPERNPLTNEGILLGEILFNDPILSTDSSVSCSSCHIKSYAFTDRKALSDLGVSGNTLFRNTPTIVNVAWSPTLFWDGGAKDLESQTFGPLMHPDELGDQPLVVIGRINSSEEYRRRFKSAFQVDSVTGKYIARALAQYQRTIWSADSDYDRFINGDFELSSEQMKGYQLFEEYCKSCHPAPLFTDYSFHNIGLDTTYNNENERVEFGRFRISHDSVDFGSFKTPTLRNISITFPYMHDGRYNSLNEVINHYSSSVKETEFTDEILLNQRINQKEKELFTTEEKESLVEFLKMLTDPGFKEE